MKKNFAMLLVGLMGTAEVMAADHMVFKEIPWEISQQQLKAKNVFKDMACDIHNEKGRNVTCFGGTTYIGENASASIDFLDNKLSIIELELDYTKHSLYRYKEIRAALTDKYGLPKKCDEPTKPIKSDAMGYNHEHLSCWWFSNDDSTAIEIYWHRIIKDSAKSKQEYHYGLRVSYGLLDNANTISKLFQDALTKKSLDRKNDL
jgi:hypothetical protein